MCSAFALTQLFFCFPQLRTGRVSRSRGPDGHLLELSGPVLPHTAAALVRLLAESSEKSASLSSPTSTPRPASPAQLYLHAAPTPDAACAAFTSAERSLLPETERAACCSYTELEVRDGAYFIL